MTARIIINVQRHLAVLYCAQSTNFSVADQELIRLESTRFVKQSCPPERCFQCARSLIVRREILSSRNWGRERACSRARTYIGAYASPNK